MFLKNSVIKFQIKRDTKTIIDENGIAKEVPSKRPHVFTKTIHRIDSEEFFMTDGSSYKYADFVRESFFYW